MTPDILYRLKIGNDYQDIIFWDTFVRNNTTVVWYLLTLSYISSEIVYKNLFCIFFFNKLLKCGSIFHFLNTLFLQFWYKDEFIFILWGLCYDVTHHYRDIGLKCHEWKYRFFSPTNFCFYVQVFRTIISLKLMYIHPITFLNWERALTFNIFI